MSAAIYYPAVGHAFFDDYSEGAHPDVLAAIADANSGSQKGYGNDDLTRLAAERIRVSFDVDADVHLVAGGTQANLVTLAAMMRPFEGVIAPSTGHIAEHEAGAVEATGHKVITVQTPDGKLTPELLDVAMATHQDEHTVRPGVVYLTQATEVGTVYSGDELRSVVEHSKRLGLYVFVDGARLAMAVGAGAVDEREFAACGADAFTVGGTKVGGMFGEAIVLRHPELRVDFRYHVKQRGALLAKGRFLGAQFARFFDADGLWRRLGAESNRAAARLATALVDAGVSLAHPQVTNQVFVFLSDNVVDRLSADFGFYRWGRRDDGTPVVRLVCSWATPEAAVDDFVTAVRRHSA